MMAVTPSLDRRQGGPSRAHLIAVMVAVFASTGLIDRFSDGEIVSRDVSDSPPHLVTFVAGGIRAMVDQS